MEETHEPSASSLNEYAVYSYEMWVLTPRLYGVISERTTVRLYPCNGHISYATREPLFPKQGAEIPNNPKSPNTGSYIYIPTNPSPNRLRLQILYLIVVTMSISRTLVSLKRPQIGQ